MNRMTWPSAVLDLLEDRLEPLLELAAELGPGDERAEVEGDDALALEPLGDVAADDALGQALDDGRLADAGLADEDRVVLRPPAEDLDDAPDLLVAADDRIELAGPRLGGQVAAVLLERGVRALGVLRRDALAAADALERLQDGLLAGAVLLEQGLGLATGLGDAEQQVLGRDVLVAEAAGLRLGPLDGRLRPRVEAAASRPGCGRAWPAPRRARRGTPGRSTPSRRSVSAGMPSSGSTSALSRCSASRIGLWSRCGGLLGGDDGLLGLLGESVELHRFRSLGARGSGWLARSRKRSAAVAGLVGQVGRQDDPGPDVQVAVAVGPEAGHALAGAGGTSAGLGAGRDREQDAALGRRDGDLGAEQRLPQGERQLALQVGAPAGEDAGPGCLRTTTCRSPPPGALPVRRMRRAGVGAGAGS